MRPSGGSLAPSPDCAAPQRQAQRVTKLAARRVHFCRVKVLQSAKGCTPTCRAGLDSDILNP